jgi:hypothetical protein
MKNGALENIENSEKFEIIIKKAAEAPERVKENPFYDEEFWGQAKSPDDIYLPDSDEAISFAIAVHEIGHLSEEGVTSKEDISIDDFEATKAEEQRAWTVGKKYLNKYLSEYSNEGYDAEEITKAINGIQRGMMEIVEWSRSMYLSVGTLDGLEDDEKEKRLIEQSNKFAATHLEEYKKLVDEKIKIHEIGHKANWEKLIVIVKKAVLDILEDNKS